MFTLEQDRVLHADVLLKAWCPRMDMLALILGNGTLELRRLSWQRLRDPIKISGQASALVWKPDGRQIALGYADGRIQLVSVDRDHVQDLPGFHQAPITACCWIDEAGEVDDFDPIDGSPVSIPRESRVHDCFEPLLVLPKDSGMGTATKFAPTKMERDLDPEQLCLLISGDERGVLNLNALGTFPLGSISIADALSGSWFIPRSNRRSSVDFTIVGVDLSRDLRYLNAAIRLQNSRQPAILVQAVWNVSVLRSRHHEIRALATQSSHIEFLLSYVKDALDVGSRIWRSARKTFDMKFQSLDTLFRENAERQSIPDSLVALAVAGTLNQALMQFFSTYLQEQSISRISKSWMTSCDSLLNLIDSNLRRALEELSFRLTELRCLARYQGADIGLNVEDLDQLLEHSSRTLMKVEELYRIILDVRSNFLHFFSWILDWVNQSSEESRTNLPLLIDPFDLDRVLDFISNDLKTDRIQQFFNNAELDEIVLKHLPAIDSAPHSKQHQCNSLTMEFASFVARWREHRKSSSLVVSKSFSLCSLLPLAQCEPQTPVSLCSRSGDAHHHCLAFLHAGQIMLVLSNRDHFDVALFRLSHDAVQIGFHNDTHLAVLTRDANSTHLSLVDVIEAVQGCRTRIKSKDIGAQLLVEAVSYDQSVIIATSRQRRWPQTQASKIAVCGPRGMVSWLNGSRRVIIVDVVNDEEDNDMVDV